ncbi:MAG: hypothetical protein ABSH14_15140 [Verrucomicrobiia bacterium]
MQEIGYLQWLRDNGFPLDRSPVLQVLDGFENEDALLVPHFHSKVKNLKEEAAKKALLLLWDIGLALHAAFGLWLERQAAWRNWGVKKTARLLS